MDDVALGTPVIMVIVVVGALTSRSASSANSGPFGRAQAVPRTKAAANTESLIFLDVVTKYEEYSKSSKLN